MESERIQSHASGIFPRDGNSRCSGTLGAWIVDNEGITPLRFIHDSRVPGIDTRNFSPSQIRSQPFSALREYGAYSSRNDHDYTEFALIVPYSRSFVMDESFDFDTIIERRNTNSVKWDAYGSRDIIPLWVADMDFRSPPQVMESLHTRVDHGVFGYTAPPPELAKILGDKFEDLYGWRIEEEWITWLPGLVCGINIACLLAGERGDAVITSTPVYPPFLRAPTNTGRTLRTVPMINDDGRWRHDISALEEIAHGSSLYLLCSPHNPVGRVFTRREIEVVGDICEHEDILICSDEIHGRLILDDVNHIPTASVSSTLADRTITLVSPSKTFNLAGIGCACSIISNPVIRKRFRDSMKDVIPHVGIFGYEAALSAYTYGESWLSALLDYLRSNRNFVEKWVVETPGLTMSHVEATYLAWIDTRALGLDEPARFFEKYGVGLWRGEDFGMPGFVRLNFACSIRLLDKALNRMGEAIAGI